MQIIITGKIVSLCHVCLISVVKTLYALAFLGELKVCGCKAVLHQEDHQLT